MEFDYDSLTPAAPALNQPYSSGLSQPVSSPTAMFGGRIPGVQFAPISPLHAAAVAALHGPMIEPVYHAGLARPTTHAGVVHAALGSHLDRRG